MYEALDFTGLRSVSLRKLHFFYMDIQSFLSVKHFILLFYACQHFRQTVSVFSGKLCRHFSDTLCRSSGDTLRCFLAAPGHSNMPLFPFKKSKTRKAGDTL